jgi:hypothetical protein
MSWKTPAQRGQHRNSQDEISQRAAANDQNLFWVNGNLRLLVTFY